jgi:hypothetical protein
VGLADPPEELRAWTIGRLQVDDQEVRPPVATEAKRLLGRARGQRLEAV